MARASSILSWRATSQSMAAYSSFSSAPSTPSTCASVEARFPSPKARERESLLPACSTRPATSAIAKSFSRLFRVANSREKPNSRIVPTTAATWP